MLEKHDFWAFQKGGRKGARPERAAGEKNRLRRKIIQKSMNFGSNPVRPGYIRRVRCGSHPPPYVDDPSLFSEMWPDLLEPAAGETFCTFLSFLRGETVNGWSIFGVPWKIKPDDPCARRRRKFLRIWDHKKHFCKGNLTFQVPKSSKISACGALGDCPFL